MSKEFGRKFEISDSAEVVVHPSPGETQGRVIFPEQVHGDKIVELISGEENLSGCDAVFTENKNLALGIRTADCAPVCFSDGQRIGAAHVGWRGLCLPIIEHMLEKFDKKNTKVFVGPFIHSFNLRRDACYEALQERFGEAFFSEKNNLLTFAFRDAIMSLLPGGAGIDPRNTFIDSSLPSFRRNGTRERMVTIISFKK